MPPKKEEVKEKILLGRPGNNLKCGIVGLPNVGKSSFFNVITKSSVPAMNFPFCTIDPSESRVAVPDERFDKLCAHYKPASKVPAYLSIIDIAGLVKGAASGQGLGNAFLSNISAVDAIFHMVRAFEDPEVVHVEGGLDPIRDLEIIHEELRLKDEEMLLKRHDGLEKTASRSADKVKKAELEMLTKIKDWVVVEKKDVRFGDWNAKEVEYLNTLLLLTAKPVIYLVNMSQEDYISKKNAWLVKIRKWIDARNPGDVMIPFSVTLETTLAEKSPEDAAEYLKSLGANVSSVLPKITKAGYGALQLCYFFTCGEDEVRAWTIRRGAKAPQAAGVIHTDFERGFIMAETMKYDDLMKCGSEAEVKAAGKYHMKGKEYVVEDGDIILFKFNVTKAPGKAK